MEMSAHLAPHLPRLLWLYYMGLSLLALRPLGGAEKADRLIARSLDAVVTAIKLSRFRVAAPLRKAVRGLLADVEGEPARESPLSPASSAATS